MSSRRSDGHVLITGGAGFVGTNLASRLIANGRSVVVLDALRRAGTEENLAWLQSTGKGRLSVVRGDVRDPRLLEQVTEGAEAVFHLAAQVAVTTSLEDPVEDFSINARGTLNLLEALRRRADPPPLVMTSTNKVYGALAWLRLTPQGHRYVPEDGEIARLGISERVPLDFCSPYGCSKGAADQYVLDYARTFGLPATVFRMSCIYGPRQHGDADQGWVAHFLRSALRGRQLTIFGDGRQVRDLLYVEDLVDAFLLAWDRIGALAGHAVNIGGGPDRSVSLRELVELIGDLQERPVSTRHEDWRPADQRWYVSDTSTFHSLTGWTPRTEVTGGLVALRGWAVSEYGAEMAASRTGDRR